MSRGSLWSSIKELSGGETATLHRYAGFLSAGGHHMHVFEEGEEVTLVIRPWQDDLGSQTNEGMSGQTPGVKIYGPDGMDLSRDDRVKYRDEAFRLQNPQFDQTFKLERWDGQEDEREFRLYDDLDEALQDEIEPPSSQGEY